ncbi:hypothetical protein D3C76_1445580 [compost metagenome]
MGNAGGHLANGGEFAGLYQFILRAAQGFFGQAPFTDLTLEPIVTGPQVGGAFGNPTLQLIVGFFQRLASRQTGRDDLAPFIPGNQQEGK